MSYEITILINGNPVTTYLDNYGNKFIEGRPKSTFDILIENNSSSKILTIVSLDGYNITTNNREWKTGYTVNSFSKRLITNKETMKSLSFAKISKNHNNWNEGVIGARIYTSEKEANKFDKFDFKESKIYYDDYEGLKERGLILDKRRYFPNPFPS
jgi:hypothetical protein